MDVLLQFCCMFLKHLFLRRSLKSCFWSLHNLVSEKENGIEIAQYFSSNPEDLYIDFRQPNLAFYLDYIKFWKMKTNDLWQQNLKLISCCFIYQDLFYIFQVHQKFIFWSSQLVFENEKLSRQGTTLYTAFVWSILVHMIISLFEFQNFSRATGRNYNNHCKLWKLCLSRKNKYFSESVI